MNKGKVKEFAKKNGYDEKDVSLKFFGSWKGYDVYEIIYNQLSYVGYPYIILVEGKSIRLSTEDEAMQFLDDNY